jgi:hypothetical protein
MDSSRTSYEDEMVEGLTNTCCGVSLARARRIGRMRGETAGRTERGSTHTQDGQIGLDSG